MVVYLNITELQRIVRLLLRFTDVSHELGQVVACC